MNATRARAALVSVLALLTGLITAGWSPSPAHADACQGTSGVTVVVDFGAMGGVQVGCAPGDPSNGFAALESAGFSYAFVPRQNGLICQINTAPNPCNGAPTNAYWSYWHAQAGGSWQYSSNGAGAHNPAPGTVEGWSFGSTTQPGIAPPNRPAPPAPAPPPPGPEQPGPGPDQPNNPQQGDQQNPQGEQPPPGEPTTSSGETPTATPDSTTGSSAKGKAAVSGQSGQPRAIEPPSDTSGGTVLGWFIGAAVVAGLGGLAIFTTRRRRTAEGT